MNPSIPLLIRTLVVLALVGSHVASAHERRTYPPCVDRPRMEVAFVLDTTGSMGGMIAGAKQKIWAIANKLKSAEPTPAIRFGLVGYRDRSDAYVTKTYELSENLDEVYSKLNAFEAQGGGDEPESVNQALHEAVRDLQWSGDPAVLRVIFLVGDARPHMDYQDDVKFTETCRLANRKGILINTLQCGRLAGTEEVWREIARLTNGCYGAILQDGGAVRFETPYDREIVRLNVELDATIIPYGSHAEQANAKANSSRLAALSSESMADRSSYLSKEAYGAVIAGRGDLVVDVISGKQQLKDLDPKLLEAKLAQAPEAERNAVIKEKVEARRQLQAELQALVVKRDAEVAEKVKALGGKDDALELSAFQVLERQASDKGYRFEKK